MGKAKQGKQLGIDLYEELGQALGYIDSPYLPATWPWDDYSRRTLPPGVHGPETGVWLWMG